jgi:hypothetical protein
MAELKGSISTETLMKLVFALFAAAIILAVLIPTLYNAGPDGCTGFLRNVGSVLADMTGRSIC